MRSLLGLLAYLEESLSGDGNIMTNILIYFELLMLIEFSLLLTFKYLFYITTSRPLQYCQPKAPIFPTLPLLLFSII